MFLTLASASPSRQRLLSSAGLRFDVQPARIDEDMLRQSLTQEGAKPVDIAGTLAEAKAQRIAAKGTSGLILGSDQILVSEGQVFAKPRSKDHAAQQLQSLSGKTHDLYAAAVVFEDQKPVWRQVNRTRMTMHDLSLDDIARYLDAAWPDVQSSVGAYHVEGLGAGLFSAISGDWFTIMGLPLLEFLSYLRLRGDLVYE